MNALELFKPVNTFIFDVDGVLTDGSLQLPERGELSRKMNIKDGYALQLAVGKGYRVAIISGGTSAGVAARLQGLGITDIFMGARNKSDVGKDYLSERRLDARQVLYMGDDMPDYEIMTEVGLPVCPADAVQEIKAICRYISPLGGGQGCVRDVIEKVLKLNGDWV